MKRYLKSTGLVLLALLIALGMPLAVLAQSAGAGEVRGKQEVVYATLGPDGAMDRVYVVNILRVTKGGTITDRGAYTSVKNLTDTGELDYAGGIVTARADEGLYYYQGNMEAARLPWQVEVDYSLDGRAVSPEELAGGSGALEINIRTTADPAADDSFYDNYMLQVSVTLDAGRCTDIEADGATLANSGGDKLVTFTVMPGSDGDMTITADVENFEMGTGIAISAVPFSMDIDIGDVSEMTEGLTELAEAIGDLNEGVGELADGGGELADGVAQIKDAIDQLYSGMGSLSSGAASLSSGARELADGAGELAVGLGALYSGSGEFKAGLDELAGGSSALSQGSAAIYQGLQTLNGSLSGGSGDMDLGALTELPAALYGMADALDEVAGGLGDLTDGFGSGLSALEGAIAGIPDGGVSGESVAALYALAADDPALQGTISTLVAGYEAAQVVQAVYAGVSPAFSAVQSGLPTLQSSVSVISGGLRQTAGQVETALGSLDVTRALQQLAEGIGALTESYGAFHQGLTAYLDGVDEIAAGYGELHEGIEQSASGGAQLASGTQSLAGGIGEFAAGVAAIVSGTGELAGGARDLASGTDELADGIYTLYDGTREMEEGTRDLPDEIDEAIDELLADFDTSDFRVHSFVTGEADGVDAVQFVLQLGGITVEEIVEEIEEIEEDEGFLSRLLALFGF